MSRLSKKKLSDEEKKPINESIVKWLNEKDYSHFFNLFRVEYEYTRNPLFAWKAILLCKNFNCDIPSWAQDYLKESSSQLFCKLLEREKDRKEDIPAGERADNIVYSCLGFHGRDQFNNYLKHQKQMDVCRMVAKYQQEHPGKSELDSYQAVELKTGIPDKTVETWWRKHFKYYDR